MRQIHIVLTDRVAEICPLCHTTVNVHFRTLLITARKTRWACYSCFHRGDPHIFDVDYEVDE